MSDQNLHWAHSGKPSMQRVFFWSTKTLIRLRGCAAWFESSLSTHVRRFVYYVVAPLLNCTLFPRNTGYKTRTELCFYVSRVTSNYLCCHQIKSHIRLVWYETQLAKRKLSNMGRASDSSGNRGFALRRLRKHSSMKIGHVIFSTVIFFLSLIQEGQLSVSDERMCTSTG